jgi:hypothetical protein
MKRARVLTKRLAGGVYEAETISLGVIMSMRRLALSAIGLATVAAACVFSTAPASGAAIVQHPDEDSCFFEPGDVPGVDVFFPAACTIVTTDSGVTTIVAKGDLPEGYSLSSTFVGYAPCFGETGRIVATVSGEVSITCHFNP